MQYQLTAPIQDFHGIHAVERNDSPVPFYDDAVGPMWVMRDSSGIVGVVRTDNFERAYVLAVDELLPDADDEEIQEWFKENPDAHYTGALPEACYHRNGTPTDPNVGTGPIAQDDINGSTLDELTPELAEELGLVVIVEAEEDDVRREAAAIEFDLDIDECHISTYDDDIVECGVCEYIILGDDDTDTKVADYIRESVWAFNPDFLVRHMPDGMTSEAVHLIQQACEDANDPLLSLIVDFDAFVEDAISTDGRGHFLSSYDGEEVEIKHAETTFYAYRIN